MIQFGSFFQKLNLMALRRWKRAAPSRAINDPSHVLLLVVDECSAGQLQPSWPFTACLTSGGLGASVDGWWWWTDWWMKLRTTVRSCSCWMGRQLYARNWCSSTTEFSPSYNWWKYSSWNISQEVTSVHLLEIVVYITSARTFLSPFGASGRLHLKMNAGNLLLNLELQIGQKFADSSGAYITHLQKQANFNYTIQNINVKLIIREEYLLFIVFW